METKDITNEVLDKILETSPDKWSLAVRTYEKRVEPLELNKVILTSLTKHYQDETQVVVDFSESLVYVLENFSIKKIYSINLVVEENKVLVKMGLQLKKEELEDFKNYVQSIQPSE